MPLGGGQGDQRASIIALPLRYCTSRKSPVIPALHLAPRRKSDGEDRWRPSRRHNNNYTQPLAQLSFAPRPAAMDASAIVATGPEAYGLLQTPALSLRRAYSCQGDGPPIQPACWASSLVRCSWVPGRDVSILDPETARRPRTAAKSQYGNLIGSRSFPHGSVKNQIACTIPVISIYHIISDLHAFVPAIVSSFSNSIRMPYNSICKQMVFQFILSQHFTCMSR